MTAFDAILIVSFGGPEGPEDVMPFLRNVVRGKNIPDERLQSVAHHYELFGGVSPINGQNRELIAALRAELALQANSVDAPRRESYPKNQSKTVAHFVVLHVSIRDH